jgi:hypothetical protein
MNKESLLTNDFKALAKHCLSEEFKATQNNLFLITL